MTTPIEVSEALYQALKLIYNAPAHAPASYGKGVAAAAIKTYEQSITVPLDDLDERVRRVEGQ